MAILQGRGGADSGGTMRRRRVARATSRPVTHRWFHLFGVIALIVGLFLPLTDVGRALANPGSYENPIIAKARQQDVSTTAFTQVTAVGDFQGQIGCAPWDIFCGSTQLSNHNGLWTGVFAVPPGQYEWQVIALTQDGQQVAFDSDGVTTGTESLSVSEGEAGAYFEFDATTQEADAAAVPAVATLSTDTGTYALAPDNGTFTAIVQSPQPGQLFGEATINGAPSGIPLTIPVEQGPNEVTLDAAGALLDAEGLGYASLTISRIDGATGQPIAGGCYELESNGETVNRACDTDDGMADGSITMNFPTGVTPGSMTLIEVTAPDGVETAEDQTVDIQPGDNVVEVVTGEPDDEEVTEEATEETGGILPIDGEGETPEGDEPTEAVTEQAIATEAAAPGDLFVTLQNQNGEIIGGACFELIDEDGNVVAESCDIGDNFPFNGNTGFYSVPAGTYTLHQSGVPDGTQPAPDQDVTIPEGNEENVTVIAAAPEEPTPAPEGDLVALRQDDAGNPVGGACFELIDANGEVVESACDEDGDLPDDGRTGLLGVPEGTYTLRETRTPEGYQPAADMQVQVIAGQAVDAEVRSAPVPTEEPVATELPTEEPVATDVPTEETEPEGDAIEPLDPDTTATEEPTEEATEEPTQETEPGSVIITLHDQDNQPIGGACFELRQGETVLGPICDSDDPFPGNGNTGFFGYPSGTYTLVQTTVPEGTEPVEEQDVEIPAGGEDTVIVQAPASEDDAEPGLVQRQDVPDDVNGSVEITITGVDDPLQNVVCVQLGTSGIISLLNPPAACDNGEADADDTAGVILLEDVPAGSYLINVTDGPDELIDADSREVQVDAGETAEIELAVTPQEEPAVLPVIAVNAADEPLPGACWTLAAGETVLGPLCDDGANGGAAADGQVQFEGMEPGTWTLSQTQAPEGYQSVEPITVEVIEGENDPVRVVHEAALSSMQITTLGQGDAPVGGACYSVDGGDPVCDDDGDGVITVPDLTEGTYTVVQTTTPAGYQTPDSVDVVVPANELATVDVRMTPAPVTLQVTTVNPASETLADACYQLDGGEPVCDDGSGIVTFPEVAPGEHTLTQTQAPSGFELAAAQTITVQMGVDPTTVSVQNIPQTGAIAVTLTIDAEGGEPLSGACISIDGQDPRCDNDANDADPAEGVIQANGIALGDHSVAVTTVPAGYDAPASPETVTVAANDIVSVTFVVTETPPSTGDLDVRVQFDDESLIEGICVVATNAVSGEVVGPVCDGGDGDTNSEAGLVGFTDLPVATWLVSLADDTQIDGGDVENTVPVSVDVLAGGESTATLTVPRVPTTGSIRIVTTDGEITVPGAGYTLTLQDSAELAMTQGVVSDVALAQDGSTTITVTDNDGTDVDGTEGVIQVDGLEPGTWLVQMTTTPDGFETAFDQEVPVTAGEISTVEIDVEATPEPSTGSLTVATVNEAGENLPGACYALDQGGVRIATACDADDGDNTGETFFADVEAGTYRLVQTTSPGRQYETAPAIDVTVEADVDNRVTVTMEERPGRLTIVTVDDADRAVVLENACYQLQGETTFGPFCDADDGSIDGRVVFTNIPAGEYTLVQTLAPTGYDPVDDRSITIAPGSSVQITVPNPATPPPPETGTLAVIPLAPNGEPVPGGCYQVMDGDRAITGRICDNADDAPARITFTGLPVGEFTLVERLAPSPDYVIADPIAVTIDNDTVTEVRVEHQLKAGSILVRAVNETGLPLEGACFNLNDDGQDASCTTSTGEILFTDLAAGTWTLEQTQAPYGYRLNETPRDVVVNPGQTTVIRVVFEVEPPPNTGTVQVQKFVCPAGEDGERTAFLGGAQGNQELKETANCVPAVAEFTLEPEDGGEGNAREFATTTEGRYQVTVEEGIYVLTETNPDLPGSSAARLRVGVGQMTTVIVINYIAPPQPEPAAINIEAYTCPPSFNGTTYGDFAGSCATDAARTNQITVRAEGENRFKQVTGDQGIVGTTTFAEVPAGSYTIYAEKPYSVPLMYMFCGANPDDPSSYKVINGQVTTDLDNGETINCDVFLIPEQFSPDTGALLVQKFSCPIDSPVKGYDFQGECGRSEDNVVFELAVFNAEMQDFEPLTQVTANADGIVRFPNLRPGTYKLTEVDSQWCFAQSNSVNADGNVIVQANRLAEVWVYNCVGTQEPPNTGSGDAAHLLDPSNAPDVTRPDARTID